jgi:hypothetical protein
MKVRAVNALGNTLAVASTSLQIVDQFEGVDDRVTSMWWGGLSQNGWGMSAVQHYAQLFNVLFVYDQDGAPTWYAQPRGKWLTGLGSTFWGPIYSPRSAPWHSYNSAAFVPGEPAGTLTLDFLGPGRARLSAKIGSQLTEKDLAPQDFSEGIFDYGSHLSDMWWGGGEQNGWGIAVFSQLESLFLVWFTYDDAGKPVWFVMPAGRGGQLGGFTGPIYRTKGAPWSGLDYDPSRLEIVSVGSFSFVPLPEDPDGDRYRFNYRFEGREGHLDLTRQPFD